MTRLSECARCRKDRRNCGYYMLEDDTDCPQYIPLVGTKDEVDWDASLLGGLFLMAIFIFLLCFDVRLFFILLVPIVINVIIVIWGVVKYMKRKKELKQAKASVKDNSAISKSSRVSGLSTRTLLQVALHKLNLHYEFDSDQNFVVRYQGEYFRIMADDDSKYLDIQDLFWYSAPLDDIDNLSILYKAVNECNIYNMARMVYTYDRAKNDLNLHPLCKPLFRTQIPHPEAYLETLFENMLQIHHFFFHQMEKLRREEFGKLNS